MFDRIRRATLLASMAGLVLAPAAQADFLGLQTGDVIDTMGYTIPAGGGVFDDAADSLVITAQADDITTTNPSVLTEINGGAINVDLTLAGETLTFIGTAGPAFVYSYTATFAGGAGPDITLNAPTVGGLPEQDGRLLVEGELVSSVSVSFTFDTLGIFGPPSTTLGGTFSVTDGDATFLQAFGMMGSLADIIGITTTTSPGIGSLVSDGFLFSDRSSDLTGTGCGGQVIGTECVAAVSGQTASHTFGGNGEVVPQNPAPFVPEPTTFSLMGLGLVGLIAAGRRR